MQQLMLYSIPQVDARRLYFPTVSQEAQPQKHQNRARLRAFTVGWMEPQLANQRVPKSDDAYLFGVSGGSKLDWRNWRPEGWQPVQEFFWFSRLVAPFCQILPSSSKYNNNHHLQSTRYSVRQTRITANMV